MVIDPTLNERENFLINENKILDLQKTSIIKRTTPKHLTLKLQDKISRSVGAGRVQLEFKRMKLVDKNLRLSTLRNISKTKKLINLELFEIRKKKKTNEDPFIL